MGLEQKDLSRMLETAVVAARLAGQRAMEEINYIKSWTKSPDQVVTQADIVCQEIIVNRIKENYPDDGFIGEEGPDGKLFKQQPRGGKQIWWVIDPVDGTNNLSKRMLLFTVAVAAMYEGEPVVGVIFDPATESMYTGVRGQEAQLNGRRITASEDGLEKLSSIGIDSHFDEGVPGWAVDLMGRVRFRTLGSSSLEFAYLAKGGLVGTIFSRLKLWDIAAGAVIAECAGATVTDWKGNRTFPVDVNAYEGADYQAVAANKKAYPQLLELLK